MKNKIIVITGATRGIGLALKEKLTAENTVVTLSRSETPNGTTAFRADVGKRDEVIAVFDEIGKLYGHIDILINNAGYGLSGATEYLPEDEIRRITDTNFLGVLWCCQGALKYMSKGAKIANISSCSAISPMPYRALYNSTKAAVTMLSYSLNCELRHLGIDCTAFILGAINTDFAKHRTAFRDTDNRYGEEIKKIDNFVDRQHNFGKMSVNRLTNYIIRKLNYKHQRIHYYVGKRYKFANDFAKVFPETTMRLTEFFMKH